MDQKTKSVLGIYPTRAGVEIAVEAFRDAGFRNADISLVLPEKMSTEDAVTQRATKTTEAAGSDDAEVAALSGPLGWLDEIGPATISGGSTFLVAGPIAQTLDDVAAECAPMELAAALIGIGVPECETEEYADKVLEGRALLSIRCDHAEEVVAARKLHGDVGGTDVFATGNTERDLGRFYRSMARWEG
jgi:hypothetical protein